MLFNIFVFLFAFLPICFGAFWGLRSAKARYLWLTISGYVFYGYWDARFCFLMAFCALVSFTAGLGLLRWSDPRRRKLCLVVPVTIDLLLLGFFKYVDFGLGTAKPVLHSIGADVAGPRL